SIIICAGKTSLTVYGRVTRSGSYEVIVEGFLTFVCVDENGVKMPHNLTIDNPSTKEDIELLNKVKNFRK
ncbi:MAG: acyl-CoA thioesterase, partial [Paraclostridium sp.]